MSRRARLSAFGFLNLLIISLLVVFVGLYDIRQEQVIYRNVEASLRSDWYDSEKRLIRSEAADAIAAVRYRRASIEQQDRLRLRAAAERAQGVATALYTTEHREKPQALIEQDILRALHTFPDDSRGVTSFLLSSDGRILLGDDDRGETAGATGARPAAPSATEARRLSATAGIQPVIAEMTIGGSRALVCYSFFRPFGWIIGASLPLSEIAQQTRSDIVSWIKKLRFADGGYVWIFDTHLRLIANPLISRTMEPQWFRSSGLRDVADPQGNHVYVQMLEQASSNGGGYVQFLAPDVDQTHLHPHLAYVRLIPELGWVLGAAVQTNMVDERLAAYNRAMESHARRMLFSMMLLILAAAAAAVLLNRYFHRRLRSAFDLFNVTFRQAALSHDTIDASRVEYAEFKELASYVNRIVEDRRVADERNRQTEARFQQAQKMEAVGRLAGGIAHDFNNLLTVIIGYAEMSLMLPDVTGRPRTALEEINASAQRAASLTHQLLAFGRKQVLKPTILDLSLLVEDLETMLASMLGEDIRIVIGAESSGAYVEADPGQMEQVILNLAVNARDAMPKGGSLQITVTNVVLEGSLFPCEVPLASGNYVRLEMRDNGIGMDAEVLQHVFEPFYTTKEEGQGTGLGLSTVYGIVQQSGGHIEVRSEPGVGSVFRLFFPRVILPKTAATRLPEGTAPARGRETILVVEDEQQVGGMITAALHQAGYHVVAAASGREALDLVGDGHLSSADLILTDVIMPDMSGMELIDHLPECFRETRILFMTGYGGRTLPEGSASIQKPFAPTDLLAKIRALLDGVS